MIFLYTLGITANWILLGCIVTFAAGPRDHERFRGLRPLHMALLMGPLVAPWILYHRMGIHTKPCDHKGRIEGYNPYEGHWSEPCPKCGDSLGKNPPGK